MLFALAIEENTLHPERSDRYVKIARQISKRMRVRIPDPLKNQFCKRCGHFLPASKARVRLRNGVLTVTCTHCGAHKRRKYSSNSDKSKFRSKT
ncbi:MAG: ribonuclease P [Methanotrichaceae archaeon]|nr:ribonuclease P [Methanotrichaceae archaeon]